jgi:hypothetical protein
MADEKKPEAERPAAQDPKPLSAIMPSSLESLTKKPTAASPNEKDARDPERLRDTVMRQIKDAHGTLLKAMKFQVPRKFEGRISWNELWKLLSPEGRKAMDYCKAWAATPDRMPGPLLMGKTGTFKTHLLWATAKEINDRAHKRVFDHHMELRAKATYRIDSGDLVFAHDFNSNVPQWPSYSLVTTDGAEIAHEVRASVERRNLDDVIARYRHDSWEPTNCALLVDDVEVMKLSDWLHEELYRVFDYRYQQALPTFVATNLNPEELRKHLGDRIARRILHMTEPFTL